MIKNNPFPKIYRELKCLWKKIKEIEQSPPGSGIQSIQDGNGTDINNTDPNNPIINILEVSATQKGIVNNTALQELGGVDKLINGVRIGRGSGNNEDNVVVGKDALSTNTTGTYNTAFGGWVLTENTIGSFNSSFGSGALYSNTTGTYNTAFGASTLQNNTTGSRNIGVGTSLFWNSTGQENTGVGSNAGYGATTGSQNTYIGNQAGYNNGIGSYNTAIGSRAMITSGTGIPASTLDMNRNVFIGAGLTLADGVNNVLAIDNRGATNTFYSNALLYGNFADRFLRINGRFEIAPSTMPTPDVNFNKKLVYNPTDGKVTAVDDTSGEGEKGEKGDQGDNGWSPKFVFEEDGATRLVKKLDSWIGGTGTAPTDNVGMYVIDGGYTADKSLAENFKGDQGGQGSEVDLMINTTHADLLTLVNNSELVAGQQYRITDYVATVDESVYDENAVGFFARSNNHAFDIIVTADSVNKLNENARAIRHEGDTYFPSHTKFESWKLKYTIFNDTERFNWVDARIGKGVIYQLIDEWNNDIPYDFKSIQFQRNDVWVYTFGGATDGGVTDASLEVQNCYENKMLSAYGLNNNTFGNDCKLNTFGNHCSSNTFGDYCSSNTFGLGCISNAFVDNCSSNIFGNICNSNTLGNECNSNTFGDNCSSNIFGDEYSYFNIDSNTSNKDFTTLISLFTTPPNGNVVNIIKTPNGAVMSQVINATTTESIDI